MPIARVLADRLQAPKLHFVDSGLACQLLGIREPEQLRLHPLRGRIFESWVASEALKARLHRGQSADLYHLRETRGLEVDLILEDGLRIVAAESKSGATVASDQFAHLVALGDGAQYDLADYELRRRIIYGGDRAETRYGVDLVPWHSVQDVRW